VKFFDVFAKRSHKNVRDEPFRLYVREDKPAALQGWIFTPTITATLGSSLFETGLTWIWESTRTGPPLVATEDDNPEHRSRQYLVPDSLPQLEGDLLELNLHGFRRFVALYGGSEAILSKGSDDDLRFEVESFAAGKSSVLSMIIVQLGDVAADVIYLNLTDTVIADRLLPKLGIPPIADVHRSPYKEMKGEELETVMGYFSCAEHDH